MSAGVGARMQIAAVGAQDKHISVDPEMSFFSKVFRQHVPFALELREQMFYRTVRFGETHSVTVFRDAGEFVGEMYLEIVLPKVVDSPPDAASTYRWCDDIGHALIRSLRLKIDGAVIHEHDKYVHAALDAMTLQAGKIAGKKEMIGGGPKKLFLNEPHTLYIPLAFYNARPGRGHGWLPLWALRASVVEVEIELEKIQNVVVEVAFGQDTKRPGGDFRLDSIALHSNTVENQPRTLSKYNGLIRLLYQSAFVSHEALDFHRDEDLLIEQIQKTEIENYTQIDTETLMIKRNFSADLPFGNSVKSLFWVVCVSDQITRLPDQSLAPTFLTELKNIVSQNRYFDFLDPIETATLAIDGKERFSAQYGSCLRTVHPYLRALRVDPSTAVYVHSFALEADSYQPTGSASMSGFSQKTLRIDMKSILPWSELDVPVVVRVFAASYNVLRCREGRGTLQFTA